MSDSTRDYPILATHVAQGNGEPMNHDTGASRPMDGKGFDGADLAGEQRDELVRVIRGLEEQFEFAREALGRIAMSQDRALRYIKDNGFVFDDIGKEPGNWKHLAFSLYSDLCEVDTWAHAALDLPLGETPDTYPASVLAYSCPPDEDAERAGDLARERGWKDIGGQGATSDPAISPTKEGA